MSSILVATTLAPALLLRVASVVLSTASGFGVVVAALDVTKWLEAVTDSVWTYVILGASHARPIAPVQPLRQRCTGLGRGHSHLAEIGEGGERPLSSGVGLQRRLHFFHGGHFNLTNALGTHAVLCRQVVQREAA